MPIYPWLFGHITYSLLQMVCFLLDINVTNFLTGISLSLRQKSLGGLKFTQSEHMLIIFPKKLSIDQSLKKVKPLLHIAIF